MSSLSLVTDHLKEWSEYSELKFIWQPLLICDWKIIQEDRPGRTGTRGQVAPVARQPVGERNWAVRDQSKDETRQSCRAGGLEESMYRRQKRTAPSTPQSVALEEDGKDA